MVVVDPIRERLVAESGSVAVAKSFVPRAGAHYSGWSDGSGQPHEEMPYVECPDRHWVSSQRYAVDNVDIRGAKVPVIILATARRNRAHRMAGTNHSDMYVMLLPEKH